MGIRELKNLDLSVLVVLQPVSDSVGRGLVRRSVIPGCQRIHSRDGHCRPGYGGSRRILQKIPSVHFRNQSVIPLHS